VRYLRANVNNWNPENRSNVRLSGRWISAAVAPEPQHPRHPRSPVRRTTPGRTRELSNYSRLSPIAVKQCYDKKRPIVKGGSL